jgi:antitoxin component YwqK of YwqJK toxin-antitoxin module
MKDTMRHGPRTVVYKNGQKKYAEDYEKDLPKGKWTEWYENGQKAWEGAFKKGKKDGQWLAYFKSGKKEYESGFRNGLPDGKEIDWYENGTKKMERSYKKGMLDGVMTSWAENGTKTREGSFKGGKKVGKWSAWYEDGKPKNEAEWKDGLLNGKYLYWNKNGSKLREGAYVNGLQHGPWTEWYANGLKMHDGQYGFGVQCGTWKCWDKEGNPKSCADFKAHKECKLASTGQECAPCAEKPPQQVDQKKKPAAKAAIDVDLPVTSGNGLHREIIQRTVWLNQDLLMKCYLPELEKAKTLAGKVRFKLVIAPNGKVTEGGIVKTEMNNGVLEPCVLTALKRILYPKYSDVKTEVIGLDIIFKPK